MSTRAVKSPTEVRPTKLGIWVLFSLFPWRETIAYSVLLSRLEVDSDWARVANFNQCGLGEARTALTAWKPVKDPV